MHTEQAPGAGDWTRLRCLPDRSSESYSGCEGKISHKWLEHVNLEFDLVHNDPNNQFPSGAEVNGGCSNFTYGEAEGRNPYTALAI